MLLGDAQVVLFSVTEYGPILATWERLNFANRSSGLEPSTNGGNVGCDINRIGVQP